MSQVVLQTQNLSKHYGSSQAVQNLSFQVEKGQVFGLLGPNGSGKTTTLGMISGICQPTAGTFSWFGEESSAQRRRQMGIILEKPNFYPYLSLEKNLNLVTQIKQISDKSVIHKALKQVGLIDRSGELFKNLSLGMKQRLSIASSLLSNPDVLILDEPTNGLDPQGIAEVRNLIKDLAKEGKTILLASHLLDEVQKVCTHFMILRKGVLQHQGATISGESTERWIKIKAADHSQLASCLVEGGLIQEHKQEDQFLLIKTQTQSAGEINAYAASKGIFLDHLETLENSIEQKFMEILKG